MFLLLISSALSGHLIIKLKMFNISEKRHQNYINWRLLGVNISNFEHFKYINPVYTNVLFEPAENVRAPWIKYEGGKFFVFRILHK